MGKAIIFAVLAYGFWQLLRGGAKPQQVPKSDTQADSPPEISSQRMVQCAHCGTYVPQSEAVMHAASALNYCSAEHMQAAQSASANTSQK